MPDFRRDSDDLLATQAEVGLRGQGSVVEMMRRLKDSNLEQQNATNRLTRWLIVLTAVILLLNTVMAAPLIHKIFNFYFST